MSVVHTISDLSKATPSEALSQRPQAEHWRVINYACEGLEGKLLYSGPETNPPDVTLHLGLQGWHRVTVGLWGGTFMHLAVRLKLSGDQCFRELVRERPSNETIEEVFFTCADLTGQDLILGSPLPGSGVSTTLAYVRCEPLSAQQINEIEADRQRTDCRRIIAYNDGDGALFFRDSEEEIWELIEPYRHSDVESIFWGLLGETTSFPAKHGRMYGEGLDDFPTRGRRLQAQNVRALNAKGINPIVTAMEYAHAIGLQFHIYQRMGADTVHPPYDGTFCANDFYQAHPEWSCVSREGIPIPRLSYAYPQVRRHKIDLLAEVAAYGADGVNLCFLRGPVFVAYEAPLVDGFRQEFGQDPRELDEWDERWLRYRCRAMTEFVRELRQELDAIGRKLGKRLAISAGTFPTAQGNLYYGLDPETWIAEGLVDRLTPRGQSHGMGPVDLKYYAQLTQDTSCSFWPHLPMRKEGCLTAAQCRHKAQEYCEAGADGLSIWDMPHDLSALSSALRRLGHIDELESREQQVDKPEEPVVKELHQLGGLDLRVKTLPATHPERLNPDGAPHLLWRPY